MTPEAIETVGYVGGILFAICAFPQAFMAWRQGHSEGLSTLTLFLWFSGEVLTASYVIFKHGWDWPLLINYFSNIGAILVIFKYKFFPVQLH